MSPWHESRERSCIPPAVPSTGWPVGRMEFSVGMDSQQSIYLHLIIWQLQGRESWGSTIPSWCLICHSFSYWIFLFKAALLMLQPQHPCNGREGRGTSVGFKQGKKKKKEWTVGFSNHTYWRMYQIDCITSYLGPSLSFFPAWGPLWLRASNEMQDLCVFILNVGVSEKQMQDFEVFDLYLKA